MAAPLRVVAEETAWFARDTQVRVMHVVTTADLRDQVLNIVMAGEFHADNRAPFVRLDDSFSAAEPGWQGRLLRLRGHYADRAEALIRRGMKMPPLSPVTAASDPLISFARSVGQLPDAWPAPMHGLVVVLAPTRVEDVHEWDAVVGGLTSAEGLAGVRWVIVDLERTTIPRTLRALAPRTLSVSALVDGQASDDEMAATLARAAAAPPDAPVWATMGAAWPRGVSPPPRPDARPPLPPAQLKAALVAAGVSPAITPEEGHHLRGLVLRAAQALKEGRGPDAVRLQREARDACESLAMPAESIVMELILGAYLVQLRQPPLAMEAYRRAATRASQMGLLKEEAQAYLALGALHGIEKRPDDAAIAYVRAGGLARQADLPILAIEAFRLAGINCRDRDAKIAAWRRALEVAGPLEPAVVATTSAAETARALAEVLRRAGLLHQATAMEKLGVAYETADAAPVMTEPGQLESG